MSTIVEELDSALKTADKQTAHELERLVREALASVANRVRKPTGKGWPPGYFDRIPGAFKDEPFERPPQLPFEKREEW
ncbi:MAG: hypothetical protein H7062_17805 [Candidatus Saccharimonas sp.]|nr:hypothetical protein [Planctomycetaceae bacterium]